MRVDKDDEYTCAHCGGTYIATKSHDEAAEECQANFGTSPEQTECAVICDDCYRRIMRQ